jgi:hypothetical protein
MITYSRGKHLEQRRLQQQLLHTLRQCSSPASTPLSTYTDWPSTRQLADALGISIYKTRHLLLDMASQNLVMVTRRGGHQILHWHPVSPFPCPITG